MGYSVTVLGSNVIALASPRPAATAVTNELEAYNEFTRPQPLYRDAWVTEQGSSRRSHGLFIVPGQTTTLTKEFYVPNGRFDSLVASVVCSVYALGGEDSNDAYHHICRTACVQYAGRFTNGLDIGAARGH